MEPTSEYTIPEVPLEVLLEVQEVQEVQEVYQSVLLTTTSTPLLGQPKVLETTMEPFQNLNWKKRQKVPFLAVTPMKPKTKSKIPGKFLIL